MESEVDLSNYPVQIFNFRRRNYCAYWYLYKNNFFSNHSSKNKQITINPQEMFEF